MGRFWLARLGRLDASCPKTNDLPWCALFKVARHSSRRRLRCERPPGLRRLGGLRRYFLDAAATLLTRRGIRPTWTAVPRKKCWFEFVRWSPNRREWN